MHLINSIIDGLMNLKIWFHVIWNDRNWDYVYILKILSFKIKLMRSDFEKYERHEPTIKELTLVENLCNKILEDAYEENHLRSHDKKWGELEFNFTDENNFNFTRKNVITEYDKKQESKEFRLKLKKSEKNKQSDINFLFKYIAKNIMKWWY